MTGVQRWWFVAGFFLAAVSVFPADEPSSGLSPEIRTAVQRTDEALTRGDYPAAFQILKQASQGELGEADRTAVSNAQTQIGIAEYQARNYGNAQESFREALRLEPTNRRATELFLRLRREMAVEPGAIPSPEPVDQKSQPALADILKALTQAKQSQDLLVKQLAKPVPANASSAEGQAILSTVKKLASVQQEVLVQTRQTIDALEAQQQELAQMGERYQTALPSWGLLLVVVLAALLLVTSGTTTLLVVGLRRRLRQPGLLPSEAVPMLTRPNPPLVPAIASAPETARALTTPFSADLTRRLGIIADLSHPLATDPDSLQWILLLHEWINVCLGGTDLSPFTAKLSRMVAKRLGLTRLECEAIYRYALIHDFGYLLLDQNALVQACSEHSLSPEEKVLIQSHTSVAGDYLILMGQAVPPELVTAVSDHHERLDGSGYPRGLSGDEIPLAARIIGTCETYLALQSPRKYRPSFGPAETMTILSQTERARFDQSIVSVLGTLTRRPDW